MVLDQIEQAACVTLPNRSLCMLQIGLRWNSKIIDGHLTCCIMLHYMYVILCYIKYLICLELGLKSELTKDGKLMDESSPSFSI